MFGAIIYSIYVYLNPFTFYISEILLIFMEVREYQIFELQLLFYLEFYFWCIYLCLYVCVFAFVNFCCIYTKINLVIDLLISVITKWSSLNYCSNLCLMVPVVSDYYKRIEWLK